MILTYVCLSSRVLFILIILPLRLVEMGLCVFIPTHIRITPVSNIFHITGPYGYVCCNYWWVYRSFALITTYECMIVASRETSVQTTTRTTRTTKTTSTEATEVGNPPSRFYLSTPNDSYDSKRLPMNYKLLIDTFAYHDFSSSFTLDAFFQIRHT